MLGVACGLVALGLLLAATFSVSADPAVTGLPHLGDGAWWLTAAVLGLQAACLVPVDRLPALWLTILATAPLVLALVVPNGAVSLTTLAVVVGGYLAISGKLFRPVWLALPIAGLPVIATQFANEVSLGPLAAPAAFGGAVLQGLVVVGLGLLPGMAVVAQRDLREARHRETLAQHREQEALLKAAVEHQRAAMSRELHDIAAHHMSGIALVAGTIGRQIDTDPAAAKELARHVREQSSGVLDDLRRLVGLLREDTGEAPAIESLDAVPGLVAARRAAGMDIDLVVPGGPEDVGAGVGPLAQVVGYRMVQESLANAAVHAPGAPCVVEFGRRSGHGLTVVVRNAAGREPDPGPGGGFGLVGMTERAQLVGGGIQYGAIPGGGWEVRLTLPVGDTGRTAPAHPQEESG
ncbi:hypothetical protein Amsp01_064770 [Amycolatopsis sp. NBRC 101858]|uniref:sensor histidine kinase n=1 Tax=Amycolatopsis sp. NBRC 101858 TaxID=3032200 RepID=UPI0024A108D6|nr:histidine kinase [Amycolatopsis sp. NBRC 101858]GLY40454.1 hypothetical protein Amsp01_064770 [Amycolatopsis sp. NBRC 101858]